MNNKTIIFGILDKIFIWPEAEKIRITQGVQGLGEDRDELALLEIKDQLEDVLLLQEKTLQKAKETNPEFYPELSKKLQEFQKN